MEVRILECTKDPVRAISLAAGRCYGKEDESLKRVKSCMQAGHMSVFEHAYATFEVKGISRACSHQLVRHRLASFCQESQRYCKIDVDRDDWYVTPPLFVKERFSDVMKGYAENYKAALEGGFKAEDARYLLPEACKTNIVVTMNCREFLHFVDLRTSRKAQWEISSLATMMWEVLLKEPGWPNILDAYLKEKTYQSFVADSDGDAAGNKFTKRVDVCLDYLETATPDILEFDPVDKPEHYAKGSLECIDWIRAELTQEEYRGYLKGCMMKYLWRYEDKGKPIQDLEKLRKYAEFLIEEIERGDENDK